MTKKLGMTLAMILLTAAVGARSSTLIPASLVLRTGTAANCPFIPANCCKFKIVSDCPICTQTC